ncbi:hypothetical protein [Stenotrophomonas sp.]|uniref:hypothetical protein n=1 Tax=Stenotrophomonas sp. TaxID=69392 RepID=UPI0039C9E10B
MSVSGTDDSGGPYADQWPATHVVGASHDGWIGQDDDFRCMTYRQVAQRGMDGAAAAQCVSDGREWFDQIVKGNSAAECAADQSATSPTDDWHASDEHS